tara:strand:+ start:439 stop:762 length:324 start_codon:yes stop_codon:yes gene_type:complete
MAKSKKFVPRNCGYVITQMLTKIPKSKDTTELIEALEWNRDDASYKAPEETLQWQRTTQTLMKYIPDPSEDWQFEVLSIFTTRTVDEVKKIVIDTKLEQQSRDESNI